MGGAKKNYKLETSARGAPDIHTKKVYYHFRSCLSTHTKIAVTLLKKSNCLMIADFCYLQRENHTSSFSVETHFR